jgi:hypothetical protein
MLHSGIDLHKRDLVIRVHFKTRMSKLREVTQS